MNKAALRSRISDHLKSHGKGPGWMLVHVADDLGIDKAFHLMTMEELKQVRIYLLKRLPLRKPGVKAKI
jgi:hypothetical protein